MSYVQLLSHSFVQYNVVSFSPLNNLNKKMWDPFSWDVTLHRWVISYKHFKRMQHLHLQGSWTLYTWNCMHHISSKCSQYAGNQFTQWCIIISQENGILNYTAVKTSKLAATITRTWVQYTWWFMTLLEMISYVSDQKVHINMCPISDGYGVMATWRLEQIVRITENKWNKIIN